jgi:hypothetical protein
MEKVEKRRGFITATGYWEEPTANNYMPRRIGAQ